MDLQEMQRQFGEIVSLAPVMITTLWRVASVSLAETNLRISQRLCHSWTTATIWSKLVKRMKRDHESHLVPFVARIGAGFMLNERRRWQDSDILDPFSFTGEVWQAPGSRQPI